MNLTAGLMSSEEAYAEKQEATNEHVVRNIPVIKYGTDNLPFHHNSRLVATLYPIKIN